MANLKQRSDNPELVNLIRMLEQYEIVFGKKAVLFLVDDEPDLLELIADDLSQLPCDIHRFHDPLLAVDEYKKIHSQVMVIISDYHMPNMTGLDLRKNLNQIDPRSVFVIVSGNVDTAAALKGIEYKITCFLNKPFQFDEFIARIYDEILGKIQERIDEKELLTGFISDAENLVEQADQLILDLEDNPNNKDILNSIFGVAHTIKGSSAFFDPKTLNLFIHAVEDRLKIEQKSSQGVSQDFIDYLFFSFDQVKLLLKEFKLNQFVLNIDDLILQLNNQTKNEKNQLDQNNNHVEVQVKKNEDIKVEVKVLDEFLVSSGEMTVIRNMINKSVQSLEKKYSGEKDVQLLSDLLEELNKINSQLQYRITEVRKISIKHVLKSLPRAIRDITKQLNKKADFEVIGDELRVDTSIAEVLTNSLIHMIRNSLDHGLEIPEERIHKGKNPQGKITIKTYQKDDLIFVELIDDGKGINTEAVKKKAMVNSLYSADQLLKMNLEQIHLLIFESGFSTAEKITDLSGRGVGMSMVKSSVESVGGHIRINSQEGRGTQFTLVLPVPKSVLIKNCLFIWSQNQMYGIYQDDVQRIIKIDQSNSRDYIQQLEGATIIKIDSQLFPVLNFNDILNLEVKPILESEFNVILIKNSNQQQYAVKVDDIVDFEDTVIKQLPEIFRKLKVYAGATFMNDGTVGLVVNTDGISERMLKLTQSHSVIKPTEGSLDQVSKNEVTDQFILFQTSNRSIYAIDRKEIYRIENMSYQQLSVSGQFYVVPYRSKMMTCLPFEELLNGQFHKATKSSDSTEYPVLVVLNHGRYIGIIIQKIIDIVETKTELHPSVIPMKGIRGQFILGERIITQINLAEILELNDDSNEKTTEPAA